MGGGENRLLNLSDTFGRVCVCLVLLDTQESLDDSVSSLISSL